MTMKTYTYEEAHKSTLEYFFGDEFVTDTFLKKYLLKNKENEFVELNPDHSLRRLAGEFARIDFEKYNKNYQKSFDRYYDALKGFARVCAQGSPMSAIGNIFQVMSASNCVVVPAPKDSIHGIFSTGEQLAQLYKRRAGVGTDLSLLRPEKAVVNNAARTTTGAWSFADFYSHVTNMIGQKARRGALMLTMDVMHPDILKFAKCKHDITKVTGANISVKLFDEFMKAVESDSDFTLKWPVDSENPIISTVVKARDIWNEIIDSATKTADPGLMFIDTIKKNLPADFYEEFKTVTTNPCFAGSTMIAVADGRGLVSIKQLAEEGKDVPVYSVNPKTGIVSIKLGRNPRITGHSKKLIRIHLDDGASFDVTPDHKCLLKNGESVLAKDLKRGDSLPRFSKTLEKVSDKNHKPYYMMHCNVNNHHDQRIFEHRMIAKFFYPQKWENTYQKSKSIGFAKTGGLVVHHKDYNQLNNSPDNLEIMTFKDHHNFHANHDFSGEKNPNYLDITNDQLKNHAVILTNNLQRRFSKKEWINYAKVNNLPQKFSDFRSKELGSLYELSYSVAKELGFINIDADPRLVKTMQKAEDQNYIAEIIDNKVMVQRACENCNCNFTIEYDRREQSYCGIKCSLDKRNKDILFKNNRINNVRNSYKKKLKTLKSKQAELYSLLKFNLNRDPKLNEWEGFCKENNTSFRLRTKFGFNSFKEVKSAGDNFNHKVVKIEELDGDHTVYNITVDDNHTLGIITNTDNGNQTGVYVYNCGEVPLSEFDSCRLMSINLTGYVRNAFKNDAYFDFVAFEKDVRTAMNMIDNLVDIEIELVEKIKSVCDSESEKEIWNKLQKSAIIGRRTGLGTHGLADTLAQLNIKYDSQESLVAVDNIYKNLRNFAYDESVELAIARGSFSVFNFELEKDCEFIKRLPEPLYNKIKKHGRRNISILTQAPTGTTSIISKSGQFNRYNISSGIEPVFRNSYTRRKKINPGDQNVRVDFVDEVGESWQEFKVFHSNAQNYLDINNLDENAVLPDIFVTSDQISWEKRVELQGIEQQYIDHSISATINLPKGTPPSLVSDIYMKAWKSGLKGITVYVEGSKSGVLVSEDQLASKDGRPAKIIPSHSPKRPKELSCEIHHATAKGSKWTILVGLMQGQPYEIFAGLSNKIHLPEKYKIGKIFKSTKGKYNLHVDIGADEDLIIEDIIQSFDNPESAWATRMISVSLRHGVPVEFICDQLSKDGFITDINKVLARVLKKYIKEGTKVTTNVVCPDCGGKDLVYSEGCIKCISCSYSKCG